MELQIALEIIIIIFALILLYAFILYPLLLWIFSIFFNKPVKADANYKPSITILIAAYNEELFIKDAIVSIYESGYPIELINVIIGSDGSTDNTADVVSELQGVFPHISFYEFPRSGKNILLNQIVLKAKTNIILFMDADFRVRNGTINKMISKFADSEVGLVMSSIIINDMNDNIGRFGESLYQKIENYVRKWESQIFSNTNCLGIYSMKREIFSLLPNDLVCDDFYEILYTSVMRKRAIFDPEIDVVEVRKKSLKGEINRRVRLVAGGLATIWQLKRILLPNYGWVSFFVLSHKISRYLTPIILICTLILSVFLNTDSLFFKIVVCCQFILYFSAFLGWLAENVNFKIAPLRIALFFITMNIGFMLGILRFLFGGQNAKWDRI